MTYVLAMCLFGVLATFADLHRLDQLVIQVFEDSLAASHLLPKDAMAYMEIDAARLSRMRSGEWGLPLGLIARMPLNFQVEFMPRYMFAVVRQTALEIAHDVVLLQKRSA